MAAYDLDEQRKTGRSQGLVGNVSVTWSPLCVWWWRWVIAATRAGNGGQPKQSAEASTLYFALQRRGQQNEAAKVKGCACTVAGEASVPATPHAAHSLAPGQRSTRVDLATAKPIFGGWWYEQQGVGRTEELARLRLATVLIDQKQFDGALCTGSSKHSESFAGLFLDMKGDIFNLQGKRRMPGQPYEAALAKLDAKGLQKHIPSLLDALSSWGRRFGADSCRHRRPRQCAGDASSSCRSWAMTTRGLVAVLTLASTTAAAAPCLRGLAAPRKGTPAARRRGQTRPLLSKRKAAIGGKQLSALSPAVAKGVSTSPIRPASCWCWMRSQAPSGAAQQSLWWRRCG